MDPFLSQPNSCPIGTQDSFDAAVPLAEQFIRPLASRKNRISPVLAGQ